MAQTRSWLSFLISLIRFPGNAYFQAVVSSVLEKLLEKLLGDGYLQETNSVIFHGNQAGYKLSSIVSYNEQELYRSVLEGGQTPRISRGYITYQISSTRYGRYTGLMQTT